MAQERLINFTIAVPVHNGEPFIVEAMESLLNQTYPHFDIVVLENASTDNTVEIIQRYNDPRIRIQPSDELLSIEDNWERILMIENANEYLVLMCADDILYPEFLAEIAKLIVAEPGATLYHMQAVFIDDNNQLIRVAQNAKPIESPDEYLTALHTYKEDAFGTGYVMRFKDFQKVGGFTKFNRLLFADFYCYYALTKLGYKVCGQSQLVGFRRNTQGETSNASLDDLLFASQQYQIALLNDPTFLGEDLLKTFLETFLLNVYRIYLVNKINKRQKPDKVALHHYEDIFLSEHYRNHVFDYDFPIKWYAQLARFPIWIVRVLVMFCLRVLVVIRRRLAKQKAKRGKVDARKRFSLKS